MSTNMDILKVLLLRLCCLSNKEDEVEEPQTPYQSPTFLSDLMSRELENIPGRSRQFQSLPGRFTQPPVVLPRYHSKRETGRPAGSRIWRYDDNMGRDPRSHTHLRDIYFGDEGEYQRTLPDYQGLEQKMLLRSRCLNLYPFQVD